MPDRRLRHRLFMLGFIASPLVVLAVLVYGITYSLERGPSMNAEPIGAGAGDAGGANALGESLFGAGGEVPAERSRRGALLVVRDLSGAADDANPVAILTNLDDWRPDAALPMERFPDGSWRLIAPQAATGDGRQLAFRFVLRPSGAGEIDQSGVMVGARRLPLVEVDGAAGEGPLRFDFEITGFEAR